jgi:hypothetical protein
MDTSLEQAGTGAHRVKVATWWAPSVRPWHHPIPRTIVSLIVVAALVASVAAGSWLVWTLTNGALGRQAASLAVVSLLGGTVAISREIARRT